MSETSPPSNNPFWKAIVSNDVDAAKKLLERAPKLVSKDFRSEEEQREDPYDVRHPLAKACQLGHLEMVKLLLDYDPDVDGKIPTEEQRDFGRPILTAVAHGHYAIANLLLDHGASVGAYGYCSASLVEELYEAARKAGAPVEMVRKGFEDYLGKTSSYSVSDDVPEVIQLFDRVLTLGGKPSLESIVLDGYDELVEELLRKCPEAPGTPHDHPGGSVFVNLCNAASWNGFPRVLELAMECCPQLYTPELAKGAIRRAIVSHNRSGTVGDYFELIETQLKFLSDQGELESTIADGSLNPHYLLAKHYRPGRKKPVSGPSTVESMKQLTELFIRFGFDDLNQANSENGLTPLVMAQERKDDPGLEEYAAYLVERGALSNMR